MHNIPLEQLLYTNIKPLYSTAARGQLTTITYGSLPTVYLRVRRAGTALDAMAGRQSATSRCDKARARQARRRWRQAEPAAARDSRRG